MFSLVAQVSPGPSELAVMREERDDRGFTLIELMVVMATIGILMAIVIPKFTRVQTLTYDRTAQEALVTGGGVQVGFLTLQGKYLGTLAELNDPKTGEPSVKWAVGATPNATKTVFVSLSGTTNVYLSTKSVTGTCFYLQVPLTAAPTYATDPACGAATAATYTTTW
jgi:prepilin-type N-terminal cleavage/methylation domain-containing protein